jgi:hypothetical protein
VQYRSNSGQPTRPAPPVQPIYEKYDETQQPQNSQFQTQEILQESEWIDDGPSRLELEQSVKEKEAAEQEMRLLLDQQHFIAEESDKIALEQLQDLEQATLEAELAEKAARESKSRVQILEARQAASITPAMTPPVPSQTFESEYSGPDHSAMVEDLRRRRLREEQRINTHRSESPAERTSRIDDLAKDLHRIKRSRFAKPKKFVKPQRQRKGQEQQDSLGSLPRDARPKSKSLNAFTTGEKDQFLNQMAKHAAEILFMRNDQSIGKLYPQGVDGIMTGGFQGTSGRNSLTLGESRGAGIPMQVSKSQPPPVQTASTKADSISL